MRAFVIMLALLFAPLAAAQDSRVAADIELTAREVGRSLRCVVCQNQSIEDSDALLAADMRAIVRARLTAGDSPAQVTEFMRERYGDYVLLKPPVQGNTYILWFAPFILVLLAGGWALWPRRRSELETDVTPLSEEESAQIARLKQERGA